MTESPNPKRRSIRHSKYRHPQKWRVDYDYEKKLSDEEYAYLQKFNREYYSSSFDKEGSLHNDEQRRELYAANNIANRDIATATGNAISGQLSKPADKRCHHRYYSPDDHAFDGTTSLSFEDAVIEAIDRSKS